MKENYLSCRLHGLPSFLLEGWSAAPGWEKEVKKGLVEGEKKMDLVLRL